MDILALVLIVLLVLFLVGGYAVGNLLYLLAVIVLIALVVRLFVGGSRRL